MVRFPLPGPGDLLRVADRGYAAIEQAIALVPRLAKIIDQVEVIADRADAVITEVDRTRQRADRVVAQTEAVVQRSGQLFDSAEQLLARSGGLLEQFEPSLSRLAPLADELANTTSPAEVRALIALIDNLPLLVAALETDILPILATLGTVAPDVRDLLDTTREFNEILGSVPGLGRIKKRVEERQDLQDVERP